NLQFRVAERKDVLLVPNAALRYRPAIDRVAPEYAEEYARKRRRKPTVAEMKTGQKKQETFGTLWVDEGGLLRPIRVKTGLTDGAVTEIIEAMDGDIADGTELVTGEVQKKHAGGSNPFAPKLWGKKK